MLGMTRPALAGMAVAVALTACKGRTEQTAGGAVDTALNRAGAAIDTAMSRMPGTTTWSNPTIIGFAVTANDGEVKLGRLAVHKATNPEVRAYGRLMVTDHSAMLADTKQLATKMSIAADTTAGDVRDLAIHGRDALKDLTEKPVGADWDKNYMDKMVDGHENVLKKLQDAASKAEGEVKTALDAAITKVQVHLDRAKEVRSKLQ